MTNWNIRQTHYMECTTNVTILWNVCQTHYMEWLDRFTRETIYTSYCVYSRYKLCALHCGRGCTTWRLRGQYLKQPTTLRLKGLIVGQHECDNKKRPCFLPLLYVSYLHRHIQIIYTIHMDRPYLSQCFYSHTHIHTYRTRLLHLIRQISPPY